MTALPDWLGGALQAKLENISRTELRDRARRISERYRSGGGSDVIRSDVDALAYAVARMPATYAAVRAALTQTAGAIPDFTPRSLLDVGAGPGTATWAALDAWPTLRDAVLVDANPHLLTLATGFAAAAPVTPSMNRNTLAAALAEMTNADVVMASYVLTELTDATLAGTLERLWRVTDRLLVVVEPGTPDGFRRILACRDLLLTRGARIIAPCSHEGRCPLMAAERWCHFSARLPRSRAHLATKDVRLPYEDEKFAYLVAGKGFGDPARGHRVLATPKVDKSGLTLMLCASDVVDQRRFARGDKNAYRQARRLDWGDAARP